MGRRELARSALPGRPDPLDVGEREVGFTCPYMCRRVRKTALSCNGSGWDTDLDRRFIWAGWLMLLELDENNDIVRKHTWGLDLAGQNGSVNDIESAAGIGGPLATEDLDPNMPQTGGFLYFYDENGNVSELINCENDNNTLAERTGCRGRACATAL